MKRKLGDGGRGREGGCEGAERSYQPPGHHFFCVALRRSLGSLSGGGEGAGSAAPPAADGAARSLRLPAGCGVAARSLRVPQAAAATAGGDGGRGREGGCEGAERSYQPPGCRFFCVALRRSLGSLSGGGEGAGSAAPPAANGTARSLRLPTGCGVAARSLRVPQAAAATAGCCGPALAQQNFVKHFFV
ncbi:uncharacterized protein LOC131875960 [Cryptomeria japonica]|uniref:uncharacterized protein LOC131875960 n=1 Tax=Cryptomeria japonica TaxID=3369 RepID=UPI0027D9DA52|nr:uncharacterized protein LOC131875960 [Cryptomeria japonica]